MSGCAGSALPDTHKQLERAITREAREHAKRQRDLHEAERPPEADAAQVGELGQQRSGAAAFRSSPQGTPVLRPADSLTA